MFACPKLLCVSHEYYECTCVRSDAWTHQAGIRTGPGTRSRLISDVTYVSVAQ